MYNKTQRMDNKIVLCHPIDVGECLHRRLKLATTNQRTVKDFGNKLHKSGTTLINKPVLIWC